MENLIFSLNAVLPLVFLMLLGAFLRKINVFDKDFLEKANKFIFKVLFPFFLFNNIYASKITEGIDSKFIIFVVIISIAVVGLLIVIIPKYEKDNKNRGVIIQGLYRGNTTLFATALISNIFGNEGLAIVTMLIAIISPTYIFLTVIILDLFTDERQNYKKTLISILSNPLIIGSLLGIAVYTLHIKLPLAMEKTIADIAKTTTPIALMTLGGEIEINNIWKNIKPLVFVVAGKLIIFPAIATLIAISYGYRGVELGVILSMTAPPTAVT
ncbi:MAG: AEC family transporter, partial [Tissierellia bacterium]|nr:AEC family transporter [Tissierellia bacterium]